MLGLAAFDPRSTTTPYVDRKLSPQQGAVRPLPLRVPQVVREGPTLTRVIRFCCKPHPKGVPLMEDERRYLDGPKFTRWLLEEEHLDYSSLTDSQKRRWREWTLGARADLYGTVDQILTDNLIAIRLIPEECWTNQQRYKNGRPQAVGKEAKRIRSEGRLLLAAGVGIKEIAEKLGVTETTVRKWRRKMAAEEEALAA